MKVYLKNAVAWLFLYFGGIYLIKTLTRKSSVLVVLNYHNFNKYYGADTRPNSFFSLYENTNFFKQISYLNNHFGIISVEDFFHKRVTQNGLKIAITFDDGYADNYSHALPALKKADIKSCYFFLTTNYISTNSYIWHDSARINIALGLESSSSIERKLNYVNSGVEYDQKFFSLMSDNLHSFQLPPLMMTWENAREIKKNGYTIGAHTCSHMPLCFANLKQQKQEIIESIKSINNNLMINSQHFAYPNGAYNDTTLRIIQQAGIKYAYTTEPGVNTHNSNRLKIKRLGVNVYDSIGIILLKLFFAICKVQ